MALTGKRALQTSIPPITACSRDTLWTYEGFSIPYLFVLTHLAIQLFISWLDSLNINCFSQDSRSICVPLASFATDPAHKNQHRCQCAPHVVQCGNPSMFLLRHLSFPGLMTCLEWGSYGFLTSNLPSTVCTFYPYEDFSQMQPRRVSVSLYNTSTRSQNPNLSLFI